MGLISPTNIGGVLIRTTLIFILNFLCSSSAAISAASNNAVTPTSSSQSFVSVPNLSNAKLDRNLLTDSTIPKTTTQLSKNDYVAGLFSCRRCKVYIRADVGDVGVAPPTENPTSSKKPKVGAVVGYTFLLVFAILVFVACLCWKRRSSNGGGAYRQQVVVQPGVPRVENPPQVENVIPTPPGPPPPNPLPRKDAGQGKKKGEQQQPPPQIGVKINEDGKQPQPPAPKPAPAPAPRDGVIKGQKDKKPQPSSPPPPPPPPPPPHPRDEEVDLRRKRVWEGKQPQQQEQEPGDDEVGRQYKKGREGKRMTEVGEGQGNNSLGLPNKYRYEYLKKLTGNFNEKNKIGGGGFGTVYKGTGYDGTTTVAVKCLKFGGMIDDFTNEVESIGRAHHTNLVTLLGYCAENILRILVYEYMSNGSLEKWIFNPKKSLTWRERKNIIQGIAKGLVHLHDNCKKKILHRDLKPSNVLLDENKNAKLCDFGLAKLLDKDQTSTWTARAGSRGYMAPEVLGDEDKPLEDRRMTEKVDVYSFGIVVLEILFRKRYGNLAKPGQGRVEVNHLPDLIKRLLTVEMRENAKEIERIGSLAVSCIREKPEERPTMCIVLASILDPNASFNVPVPKRN